jgi:hypothetical protein
MSIIWEVRIIRGDMRRDECNSGDLLSSSLPDRFLIGKKKL